MHKWRFGSQFICFPEATLTFAHIQQVIGINLPFKSAGEATVCLKQEEPTAVTTSPMTSRKRNIQMQSKETSDQGTSLISRKQFAVLDEFWCSEKESHCEYSASSRACQWSKDVWCTFRMAGYVWIACYTSFNIGSWEQMSPIMVVLLCKVIFEQCHNTGWITCKNLFCASLLVVIDWFSPCTVDGAFASMLCWVGILSHASNFVLWLSLKVKIVLFSTHGILPHLFSAVSNHWDAIRSVPQTHCAWILIDISDKR